MIELLDFLDFRHVVFEVLQALLPLVLFFIFFQIFFLKYPRQFLINLLKGVVMVFVGLTLFLQGVQVGFLPVGTRMGEILGALPHRWILIPIGFFLGFVATIAEPAVRILGYEVEKVSTGAIREKLITYTLSIGVAVFVALGMTKIIYGIPIYYLIIPGYLLALILMRFCDPTFIAIAFDAGGVATGPMTVTFVMAVAVGAAAVIPNRDPILDGFGLIALVAMAPIISVMVLGILYSDKPPKTPKRSNTNESIV